MIQVTGSRIRRTQIAKAQPIVSITRKEIQTSGAANLSELLQRISSAGSAFNRQFSFGGSGATHIDLRYLGSQRVLVLLNGHRIVHGGNGGGTSISAVPGLSASADLSVIPTSIIARIEILQDGASAVYGSDAIAGVINIITRKDFTGAEISAYSGGYADHGFDGLTQRYNIMLGQGSKRANLTANFSYMNSNAVESNTREFSRPGIPGTGNLFKGSGYEGQYVFFDPSGQVQNLTLTSPTGSTNPTMNDLRPFGDNTRNSIGIPSSYIQVPETRSSLYVQGHYDLTDNVTFSSSLIYSDRNTTQNESNQFIYIVEGIAPRAGQQPIVLSHLNPYSPFPYDLVASGNPATNNILVFSKNFSPKDSGGTWWVNEDSRLLQYIGQFSGNWMWGNRLFNWDTSFVYGNTDETSKTHDSYNVNHLRLALGAPAQCAAVQGCVPFNMFGPNTPQAANYIFPTGLAHDKNTLRIYNADVTSSDIADLPGGPLGFALGYQHLEQDASITPGALELSGALDEPPVNPTYGRYEVNAAYGELNIPLVSNVTGVKKLATDIQARNSNYSTFGHNTSERIGLRYEPIRSLLLRATWSTGFRSPSINELDSGLSGNYLTFSDPCNNVNIGAESSAVQQRCYSGGVPQGGYTQINGQVLSYGGGNPNLQPETSISRTVGLVYSPTWVSGLDLNADYFKIEVDNAIVNLQSQDIVNACYLGGSQSFCNDIKRGPTGKVIYIRNIPRNIARFNVNGIDLGVTYHLPVTPIGDFTLSFRDTRMILYNETTPNFHGNSGFSTQGLVGTEPTGIDNRSFPDGMPRNKANLAVDWNYGHWGATYTVYYIQSTTGPCHSGTSTHTYQSVGLCTSPAKNPLNAKFRRPNEYYQDVQVSYDFAPINTTLRLGVNNLFNQKPPILLYDPTLDRIPGQFVYMELQTNF